MPSSLRRATVIAILLGVFFVPTLLQAKTPVRGGARVSRPAAVSEFFSVVWNLLADVFDRGMGSGSSFVTKDGDGGFNGGMLDPNGSTAPPDSSAGDPGFNGGMLDPNG